MTVEASCSVPAGDVQPPRSGAVGKVLAVRLRSVFLVGLRRSCTASPWRESHVAPRGAMRRSDKGETREHTGSVRQKNNAHQDVCSASQMQLGLHGLLVVCLTNGFTLPGRGIPPAGVAPRSNTTGMLPGRALSAGRRARQVRNAILRHTTRCGRPASCRVARRSEQEGRYLHLAAFEGGQERVDDLRVELGAGPIDQDLTDLVRGHRLAIGTVARQRVEDVRD